MRILNLNEMGCISAGIVPGSMSDNYEPSKSSRDAHLIGGSLFALVGGSCLSFAGFSKTNPVNVTTFFGITVLGWGLLGTIGYIIGKSLGSDK